jgi:hypothetical protein
MTGMRTRTKIEEMEISNSRAGTGTEVTVNKKRSRPIGTLGSQLGWMDWFGTLTSGVTPRRAYLGEKNRYEALFDTILCHC